MCNYNHSRVCITSSNTLCIISHGLQSCLTRTTLERSADALREAYRHVFSHPVGTTIEADPLTNVVFPNLTANLHVEHKFLRQPGWQHTSPTATKWTGQIKWLLVKDTQRQGAPHGITNKEFFAGFQAIKLLRLYLEGFRLNFVPITMRSTFFRISRMPHNNSCVGTRVSLNSDLRSCTEQALQNRVQTHSYDSGLMHWIQTIWICTIAPFCYAN